MKLSLLVAALIVSTGAYAQEPPKPPTVGGKSLVRVKSKTPTGCTFIGTVRGAKLWAGDCTAPDQLRSSVPSETPLPDPATTGALPSEQK